MRNDENEKIEISGSHIIRWGTGLLEEGVTRVEKLFFTGLDCVLFLPNLQPVVFYIQLHHLHCLYTAS